MSYPVRKVALIGTTGMLGGSVTRALTEARFRVPAPVRVPERARAKLPPGLRALAADVQREETLPAALAGIPPWQRASAPVSSKCRSDA